MNCSGTCARSAYSVCSRISGSSLAGSSTATHSRGTPQPATSRPPGRPVGRSVERSVSRCGAVRCAQVRADGEEGLPRPALSQLEPRVHSRTLHIPVHQEPRRRRHHHVSYLMSFTLVSTFTSIVGVQYCAVCSVRQRLLVYSTNYQNRVQYRSVPSVHIHNPFEQFVAVLYKSISIRSHPSHECAESSRSSRCSWRRCATTSIIAVRCPLLPISLPRPGPPRPTRTLLYCNCSCEYNKHTPNNSQARTTRFSWRPDRCSLRSTAPKAQCLRYVRFAVHLLLTKNLIRATLDKSTNSRLFNY